MATQEGRPCCAVAAEGKGRGEGPEDGGSSSRRDRRGARGRRRRNSSLSRSLLPPVPSRGLPLRRSLPLGPRPGPPLPHGAVLRSLGHGLPQLARARRGRAGRLARRRRRRGHRGDGRVPSDPLRAGLGRRRGAGDRVTVPVPARRVPGGVPAAFALLFRCRFAASFFFFFFFFFSRCCCCCRRQGRKQRTRRRAPPGCFARPLPLRPVALRPLRLPEPTGEGPQGPAGRCQRGTEHAPGESRGALVCRGARDFQAELLLGACRGEPGRRLPRAGGVRFGAGGDAAAGAEEGGEGEGGAEGDSSSSSRSNGLSFRDL